MSDGNTTTSVAEQIQQRLLVVDLTPKNVKQVQVLNSVVFPVSYPKRVYDECMSTGTERRLLFFFFFFPCFRAQRVFLRARTN